MKEIITFNSIESDKIVLPIQYNHMVQGMIYKLLDDELESFYMVKVSKIKKEDLRCLRFLE